LSNVRKVGNVAFGHTAKPCPKTVVYEPAQPGGSRFVMGEALRGRMSAEFSRWK
jgi:hypothetical protein